MDFHRFFSALRKDGGVRSFASKYSGELSVGALLLLSYILLHRGTVPLFLLLVVLSGVSAILWCDWKARIWYIVCLGCVTCFERHFILHYGDSFRAIGHQALITVHITDAEEIRSYISGIRIVAIIQPFLFAAGAFAQRIAKSPALLSRKRPAGLMKFVAFLPLLAAAVFQTAAPVVEYFDNWGEHKDFYLARHKFTFEAVDRDPESELFVLLVIGESHRKDEFDRLVLGEHGYAPHLRRAGAEGRVWEFDDLISHYQQTWFSVFTLLSRRGEDGRNVFWPEKGLFSLFREAGFRTWYVTYQKRTPEKIGYNYVVNEAETHVNHREFSGTKFDHGMLRPIGEIIAAPGKKKFAVVKMSGVHFHYTSRYPREYRLFKPCYESRIGSMSAYRVEDRELLVNTYRNAMAFSATFFDELAKMIDGCRVPAVMIFLSDHGIINYDDGENAFFGAARSNFHIPCFIMGNGAFRARLPEERAAALRKNRSLPATNSYIFDTAASLSGLSWRGYRDNMDLSSDNARPARDRMVWNWNTRLRYDELP